MKKKLLTISLIATSFLASAQSFSAKYNFAAITASTTGTSDPTPPPTATSKPSQLTSLIPDDASLSDDDEDALNQAGSTAKSVFDFALKSPIEALPLNGTTRLPSLSLQGSSRSSASESSLLRSAYALTLSSWKVCVPLCIAWRDALRDPRVAHIALANIPNTVMLEARGHLDKHRNELAHFLEHDLTQSLGEWVSFYMLCIPEPYCFLPELTTSSSPVEFSKACFEFLTRSDGGADCMTNFFSRLSNGEDGPFWHDVELPEHLQTFLDLMRPVCLGLVETFLMVKVVAAIKFEADVRCSSLLTSDMDCLMLRSLREHVYLVMFAFRVVSVAWYVLFLAVMGPVRNAVVASARKTSYTPSISGSSRIQAARSMLERTAEPALVSVDDIDVGREHREVPAAHPPRRRRSFSDFHSDDPNLKANEEQGAGSGSCLVQ